MVGNQHAPVRQHFDDFNTKDVANAVNTAGQFFEENFNEAQNQAMRLLAKAEADKHKKFIDDFGKAATEVVKDQEFINELFRVAKAKDPSVRCYAQCQQPTRVHLWWRGGDTRHWGRWGGPGRHRLLVGLLADPD